MGAWQIPCFLLLRCLLASGCQLCFSRLIPGSAGCVNECWMVQEVISYILRCLAADIVLFRDPFDLASNPLADAEMYFSIDAGPTAAEPAGAVNTGMIGMRDGSAV
jgi:hypothetical protein